MPGSDGRVVEFDYLRIAAAAAVVFIHAAATAVTGLGRTSHWNPLLLLRAYSSVAVPAFIFITGALVWTRRPFDGPREYGRFMSRRLRAVLPAYVTFSAIYWLIKYSGYAWFPRGTGKTAGIGGFLRQLITGGAWVHLYFVPLIVLVYVLTPVGAWAIKRSPSVTFVASVGLSILWSATAHSFAGVPGIAVVGRFFAYLPFVVGGAWYAVRMERLGGASKISLRAWLPLLIAGLALETLITTRMLGIPTGSLAVVLGIAWGMAVILGAAGGFAHLAVSATPTIRYAAALAPLTYVVYLAHPAVLVFYFGLTRVAHMPLLWSDPRFLVFKWGFALVAAFILAWTVKFLGERLSRRNRPGSLKRDSGRLVTPRGDRESVDAARANIGLGTHHRT